ncbi:hypothetical protein CLV30_12871 [Haloactinopolyspora alba]|uniref:Uncharacterized protein n=1 Tax=Haloactinopolyspora alba TaxID=648780 RepID=A0A2P8DF38_9ACTN|nr:hypothetical protein [Haloactinopolyspora alba]PSK95819.1 hypothetical protein CLV30_12871 [Haloactinopolyspora alba]
MTDTTALAAALATWAHGYLPDEAAVKLLTDSGMLRKVAHLARPGDEFDQDHTRMWIDWTEAADWLDNDGILSGGERRVIAAALSIAEARPVNLGEVLAGVDHNNARHILAALVHVAGLPRTELDRPEPFPSGTNEPVTFEQMRRESFRLLGEAQDVLRSDWRETADLTREQVEARERACAYIDIAKGALDEAGR